MEEEIQQLVELQIRAAVAAHLASQDGHSPAPAAAAAVNVTYVSCRLRCYTSGRSYDVCRRPGTASSRLCWAACTAGMEPAPSALFLQRFPVQLLHASAGRIGG